MVDFLDFVIVLFQSGVFEYVPGIVLRWLGGDCCAYLQNVFVYAEITVSGDQERSCEGRWEFQRSPSRLLPNMVKYIYIHP